MCRRGDMYTTHIHTPTHLSIPLSWLCDGQEDCVNGLDEDTDDDTWYICGSGAQRKCYPKKEEYRCDEGISITKLLT